MNHSWQCLKSGMGIQHQSSRPINMLLFWEVHLALPKCQYDQSASAWINRVTISASEVGIKCTAKLSRNCEIICRKIKLCNSKLRVRMWKFGKLYIMYRVYQVKFRRPYFQLLKLYKKYNEIENKTKLNPMSEIKFTYFFLLHIINDFNYIPNLFVTPSILSLYEIRFRSIEVTLYFRENLESKTPFSAPI